MRVSQLFGRTIREVPADADTISHQYLVRSGMINQLTSGIYSFLPLGLRVLTKIENIIRDESNKAGGQEVLLPVLHPVEIWQKGGREPSFGEVLFRLKDRRGREMVLGPTHEEIITDLVAHTIQSYRDLPQMPYQLHTKLRDEPRPRGGLLRVREFVMHDLYSYDVDEKGLDISYDKMRQAYRNIFSRCGLPALLVDADSGAIGGKESQEFMLVAESGEDEIIYCQSCQYAANVEKMVSVKSKLASEEPLNLQPVSTPGLKSIEEISAFLRVKPDHTLKVVLYMADNKLVMALIRGDLEINEIKLKKVLKCDDLRLAGEPEVTAAGLEGGFVSPLGLKAGIQVICDDSVVSGVNFVAGGNQKDTHIKNVNYPRDFKVDIVQDIAKARVGDGCIKCGKTLSATRGIEVGHIFKLGTALAEKMGAKFIDEAGVSRTCVMGTYGIGVGRLMAAAIEQNHDEKGPIWPLPVAPFQVHICGLFMDNPRVIEAAGKLYADLQKEGIEVLFDDRLESPGVKFNDADLIGIPFRVTVSPRTLEGNNVEFKRRTDKKAAVIPLAGLPDYLKNLISTELSR
ncbi:MAG TPA: proline--tRNA ligase [Dehalococcoidales bacterium]|nr:proline--tRNA ligase [Dehalococcoidales bacterium]